MLPPDRPSKRAARSFFKIGCLSSPFFCLSFARLLILPLLLMSGNVHPNPCPAFPCSVCAGNVTWLGRSLQCCTCSKWIYLKCSLLSFSRFRNLGSSHSWSCPHCCIPASSGDATPTSTVPSSSDSSSLYISTVQSGPFGPLCQYSTPAHPRFQTSYPFFAHFVSSPSTPGILNLFYFITYFHYFINLYSPLPHILLKLTEKSK